MMTTPMAGPRARSAGTVRRRAGALGAATLVAAAAAATAAPGAQPPAAPRLVVLLVVDQMRADYVDLYSHQWTAGLRRLLDGGAVFPNAAYPYALTMTCAGHATIATGTLPATHGMIHNAWFDRASGRSVNCTDDARAAAVPFGGAQGGERHSADRLRAPTFAEAIQTASGGRAQVVSLSVKARSAIGSVGRVSGQVAVVWREEGGAWSTSTAWTETPWADVDDYVRGRPAEALHGSVWTRLLPAERYRFEDDAPGELAGRTTFPHALVSPSGEPDATFRTRLDRSPWADQFLTGLATTLVAGRGLGRGPATDVLVIGLTSLDSVGHAYGPHSHEVQDVLARLDGLLGDLLAALDAAVGPDRYVVALSADHGVATLPERLAAGGLSAGRLSLTAVHKAILTALGPPADPGHDPAADVVMSGAMAYFAPAVRLRVAADAALRAAITDRIRAVPGVGHVYWEPDLASTGSTDDPLLRAQRLSYVAGRSGDLVVVPEPLWVAASTGSTHGTPYAYDRRVPVWLFGAGIRAGRYPAPASPADVAPTIAALARVPLPRAEGRVLSEALAAEPGPGSR